MDSAYGLPIATTNTLNAVLEQLAVTKWPHIALPCSLDEYLARRDLTDKDRTEVNRFAPKAEVVFLRQPDDQPYTGFRTIGRSWCTTFVTVPSATPNSPPLVVVTAQYKHGFDEVVLVPPSGVKKPNETWDAAAARFVHEETGFILSAVHPLAGGNRQGCSTMQNTSGIVPFVGVVDNPNKRADIDLSQNGQLKTILVPLPDWMQMLDEGITGDMSASIVTLLGMRWLYCHNKVNASHLLPHG